MTDQTKQRYSSGNMTYYFDHIISYTPDGVAYVSSTTSQTVTFSNPTGGNGGSGSASALYKHNQLEYTSSQSVWVTKRSSATISFPDTISLPGEEWVDE